MLFFVVSVVVFLLMLFLSFLPRLRFFALFLSDLNIKLSSRRSLLVESTREQEMALYCSLVGASASAQSVVLKVCLLIIKVLETM